MRTHDGKYDCVLVSEYLTDRTFVGRQLVATLALKLDATGRTLVAARVGFGGDNDRAGVVRDVRELERKNNSNV